MQPPDLVSHLLAAAVQATHSIEQLQKLSASNPTGDPQAAADIAQAISTMIEVRARLQADADRLSALSPSTRP